MSGTEHHIDDIVSGVRQALAYHGSPYEIINLGNNETVTLLHMVRALESAPDDREN